MNIKEQCEFKLKLKGDENETTIILKEMDLFDYMSIETECRGKNGLIRQGDFFKTAGKLMIVSPNFDSLVEKLEKNRDMASIMLINNEMMVFSESPFQYEPLQDRLFKNKNKKKESSRSEHMGNDSRSE